MMGVVRTLVTFDLLADANHTFSEHRVKVIGSFDYRGDRIIGLVLESEDFPNFPEYPEGILVKLSFSIQKTGATFTRHLYFERLV